MQGTTFSTFFLSTSCAHYLFDTLRFIPSVTILYKSFNMKTVALLTLLSTSLVAAAPQPFVGTGPVVAAGTEDVVMPSTNFERREAAVVDFSKRALKLRGALLAARGGQGNANANVEDAAEQDAAAAEEAANAGQAAADAEEQAKGKGKAKNAGAGEQNAKDAAGGKKICKTYRKTPC